MGLATVVKGSGGRVPPLTDHARVIIEPSGHITVHTGVSPHGQGSATTFAQVVADVLGVTPAEVQVLHSDTALLPAGGGRPAAAWSPVARHCTSCCKRPARNSPCLPPTCSIARWRIFASRTGGYSLGTTPSTTSPSRSSPRLPTMTHGSLQASNLDWISAAATRSAPAPMLLGRTWRSSSLPGDRRGTRAALCGGARCWPDYQSPAGGGAGARGLAQGIGQALLEGMVYSPEGQPVTGSLLDYALPRASTTPAFTLDTVETLSPLNPLGAKGIGELPTLAAPVAIANAVMDALSHVGVRHIDTPLTPEKIWHALRDRGHSGGCLQRLAQTAYSGPSVARFRLIPLCPPGPRQRLGLLEVGGLAPQCTSHRALRNLALSSRWLNVLVESEEICGVVPVLHGHQPRVLGWTVGRLDLAGIVLRLVIDIQAAGRERLRAPQSSRTQPMTFASFCRVGPHPDNEKVEESVAVIDRRLICTHLTDCAAEMFNDHVCLGQEQFYSGRPALQWQRHSGPAGSLTSSSCASLGVKIFTMLCNAVYGSGPT